MWRIQDAICLPDNYARIQAHPYLALIIVNSSMEYLLDWQQCKGTRTDATLIYLYCWQLHLSWQQQKRMYCCVSMAKKNVYPKASQYNVVRTLSSFCNTTEAKVQKVNNLNIYFTLRLVQFKCFECWYYLISYLTEDTVLLRYKKHTINALSMFIVKINGDI